MKPWVVILIVLLALAVVGGAAYWGMYGDRGQASPPVNAPPTVRVARGEIKQSVTAPGQVVGTKEALVSTATSGQVLTITVQPGDIVQAGDILASLDARPFQEASETAQSQLTRAEADHAHQLQLAQLDLQAAQVRLEKARLAPPSLAAAAADLKSARATLASLQAGPTQDELAAAQRRVEQARNSLWGAQAQRDGACSRSGNTGCDGAKAAVLNAELDVQGAEAALATLKAGPSAQEVAAAEAQVERAQAAYEAKSQEQESNRLDLEAAEGEVERCTLALQALQAGLDPSYRREVEQAQEALEDATIKAPHDGTVLEVFVKPGESVTNGKSLVHLTDLTALEAYGTVLEEDLSVVRIGQDVELYFDAMPEITVKGHVARILPERAAGDRTVYPVYISLGEIPTGLLPGMTVDASILIAQRSDVLRLPRTLVRAGADGHAQVKVWKDGQIESRSVVVGLQGDVNVEILEGLEEGEEVVGA